MGFDELMMKLDQTVTELFGQWDVYSTLIVGGLITFTAYQIITSRDPDVHPMLLARQAQAAPIRQEGESALFRSHSAPHGMPLNSGLNVKDPGDSKWSRGRDGDLRDVWRRVVSGRLDQDGKETGEKGDIFTVLGSEKVIKHDTADISRQISSIGQHIKQNGGSNVAIYLPNSIEFLATLFACSYYDLTAILVPYHQDEPVENIISLLQNSKADTVVAAVGSFPFDVMSKGYPALKQLIWVVDEGSKHLDWNEVPKGTGGPVNVSTWQEIVQDTGASDLPPLDRTAEAKNVLAFWPSGELVEYTNANIIAGVAGQLSSIPTTQRITNADLFLPADSLSTMYPLVLTLAALYSNASVALNSVAGSSPDLSLATQGVAPTIIVVSADSLATTHSETKIKLSASSIYQFVHWSHTRALVQQGVMPVASMISRIFDPLRPLFGTTPGKLRLIYVSEPVGAPSPPLSSATLSDLRIYTGARIIYALTSAKVAGAVTQTGLYDYRVDKGAEKYSHFGAPVTSVEIFFKDTSTHKTTDEASAGEIYARGPAVVGDETSLGISGRTNADHTLSLV